LKLELSAARRAHKTRANIIAQIEFCGLTIEKEPAQQPLRIIHFQNWRYRTRKSKKPAV